MEKCQELYVLYLIPNEDRDKIKTINGFSHELDSHETLYSATSLRITDSSIEGN